jgi:coenzyme F420-reducing hydrogenase alpha subunit
LNFQRVSQSSTQSLCCQEIMLGDEILDEGEGFIYSGFGQKILEMLGDKKVHPDAAIRGGMNKALS